LSTHPYMHQPVPKYVLCHVHQVLCFPLMFIM
jgi:hypothetical protein